MAALSEMTPLQPQDRIKGATKKAMQGLGFLHLRPTFQKLVRQHDRWKALLRAEIGKASLIVKENPKQNRRDDRRDIGRKNEIFKHGIKGTKKITGKYNTSKPLTGHRTMEGREPTRGNRILLREERLPSFRHLQKPKLW